MNISTISNVVTALMAIVVGFIVYRQYRNDRRAVRLNLYDRRYKYYKSFKEFLQELVNSSEPTANTPDLEESSFLFGKDVYDNLCEICASAFEYKILCEQIDKETNRHNANFSQQYTDKEWEEKVNKKDEYLNKFMVELDDFDNKFLKYLNFRNA